MVKIKVSGKNVDIGESLREFGVAEVEKYIGNNIDVDDIDASISISKDGKIYETEVLLHLSRGFILRADGLSGDAYKSVSNALSKLESRLKKHKNRIKNKERRAIWNESAMRATEYILDETGDDEANSDNVEDRLIIAEQEKYILSLSVSEAVMKLELGDLQVVMFKNIENNKINTVYRRKDGHIGWIDYQTV